MIDVEIFNQATEAAKAPDEFLADAAIEPATFATWIDLVVNQVANAELRARDANRAAILTALAFQIGWLVHAEAHYNPDTLQIERDHYRDVADAYGRALRVLVDDLDGEIRIPRDRLRIDETTMILMTIDGDDAVLTLTDPDG